MSIEMQTNSHHHIYYSRPKHEDVESLALFFNKSLQENFSYFPNKAHIFYKQSWTSSTIAERLKQQDDLLICAQDHNKIVGLISGTKPEGGVGTIVWLTVAKEYQKMKIGADLLMHGKKFYQEKNAHKIKLTVHDTRAFHFYLREGFEQEALHKNHWWNLDFYAVSCNIMT